MAILVLPRLLTDAEGILPPAFESIAARTKTFQFQLEPDEFFGSALLGHSNLHLNQGPLTVAALGMNPPDGSLQFHVSLVSLAGNSVAMPPALPTKLESNQIRQQMARLNTKNLTVVFGEGFDHALVSERTLEIRTSRPSELIEKGIDASAPEGDGEKEIRRFIDDSVNLLAEQEFNARRIDLGVAPINLCWPWGQGHRIPVPNRALAVGYPWRIFARSLSNRGLAKLSGFRPERMATFSDVNIPALLNELKSEPKSMAIFDFGDLALSEEGTERFHAKLGELVDPLLEWHIDSGLPLCFVATNDERQGLVSVCVKLNERDHFPFDERSLTEKRVESILLTHLLDLDV